MLETERTWHGIPNRSNARCMISECPNTKVVAGQSSVEAPAAPPAVNPPEPMAAAMISGPTPAGSPMVIAIVCSFIAISLIVRRSLSSYLGRTTKNRVVCEPDSKAERHIPCLGSQVRTERPPVPLGSPFPALPAHSESHVEMRACIQRVSHASVRVDSELVGEIQRGLLVLLGVEAGDQETDIQYMVDKIPGLRIFPDADGRMNLSALDVGAELLVVSQFTLLGDCRKGKRPSFVQAAPPDVANAHYETVVERLRQLGLRVETGIFQADMAVTLCNDGPVTLIVDSRLPRK